ncbi:glycoside hydrolase family 99-like domain-containing protein [Pseudomonas sp. NPDC077186]|uniref:glycoside hydrolase family 99-like domain-containing protein n=1 Tax=Pseudomonas sp. NPDC077186 TaxID=3364421 RepID=UPI0037C8A26E
MSVGLTKVIVVVGMHRSGTSVITRALEVLGVELGDNLMPAAENNNEKGFFEDLDVHGFNTRLLEALGTSWDRLADIDPALMLAPAMAAWHEEALTILREKLPSSGLFAFKDPQTCLLLPFWQRVLADLPIEPYYLICLRNPLSVAASLHERDGIAPLRSQLLWAQYQLAALRYSEGRPRLLVDYDAMMDRPTQQLARIALAFELTLPAADAPQLAEFAEDFLSHRLRHAQHSAEQLANREQVLQPVASLYQLMRQIAADQLDFLDDRMTQGCEGLTASLLELRPLGQALDDVDHERLRLGRQQGAALQQLKIQHDETILRLSEELEQLNLQHDQTTLRLSEELDQLRTQLATTTTECGNAWHMHAQAVQDRHELAGELSNCLLRQDQLRAELAKVHTSRSWRLMRPLRGLRRHHRNPALLLRSALSESARGLWRLVPLSIAQKQAIKHRLFSHAAPLLSNTQAYRDWQRSQEQGLQPAPSTAAPLQWLEEPIQPVPRLISAIPAVAPVKLIAFYLPQFHPIPENDAWWGEGFTEWTNVRPAQPLYEGHYQPHVPGDLGYYDLLDGQTQQRQVELAKQYGLGGFCFYFYWFGGKRLLEAPIERYLADEGLDLPFCLCWANENWSRRWDGLDSEILIGQNHSAEDDLAFIAYIARYMRDARYIRIDGRPLLLVYRPSELPDAKATASRWRTWCRENGIGEIYLAYTQSFDSVAPGRFGFDAAIEFPPNATQPPPVTDRIQPLAADFRGQVFDWSIYLKRSRQYSKPAYKLFRGVCPSWDNTARRRNRGTSFINSSPRGYQQWLLSAMHDTLEREPNPDERLIFINAWNEWAEGAHLEPDQRHGYGFLEATRMACLRASLPQPPAVQRNERLAVVIHAYYPDVLREILVYLQQVEGIALQLYLSCPADKVRTTRSLLASCRHPWHLEEVPNRGRDVLPFMKQLPRIIADGHDLLLKVHTKKSPHRDDGDAWRRDLYDKLLTENAMRQALDRFSHAPSTGILGPAGHLVPMSFYWGSNARRVEGLACRLGIRPDMLGALNFVAGTMFFAQTRAFLPLLNLALQESDFEEEAGQVDGTLAHALERTFSISASAAGLDVSSGESIPANRTYAFAEATP